MKTQTLLLIAGAVGVGYLLHKKKVAEAAAAGALAAGAPVPRIATAIPEEDADVVFVEPDVVYTPVWGGGWGPSWGGWGRRGGGGHHHHGGGHHGHHGFGGYHRAGARARGRR